MALPSSTSESLEVEISGGQEAFTLQLLDAMRGKELLNVVRDRLPVVPRQVVRLYCEGTQVGRQQTLRELSGGMDKLRLSYAYGASDLCLI